MLYRERPSAIVSRGRTSVDRRVAFETEMLAEEENFGSLARINRELIGKAEALDSPQRVVLDMDSTEIPVYGEELFRRMPAAGPKGQAGG